MNNIGGRRVFVTGGASGIGRAIVESFHANGDRVAYCDIDGSIAVSNGVRAFTLDVADIEALTSSVQSLIDEWGDIDIIINNVGVSRFKSITEITVEEFQSVIDINLRSAFITSRLLAIHREGLAVANPFGGRIINISSTRYLMSEEGSEAYAASKGGVSSLTHALAVSLSKYGITVNAISPGWIQTSDYDKLSESDHAQHPSGRVGRVEDISRTCLFLCEENNNFITAENIVIDGGMTKKMIYD